MTRKIHKSALAEFDLIGIWEYSFEQWDADQADRYLDDLDRGIRLLANNPELGVSRKEVRESYRVLFVHSHAVCREDRFGPYAYLNEGLYLGSNPGRGQGGVALVFYESAKGVEREHAHPAIDGAYSLAGAPVPGDVMNSRRPSGRVTSRPLAAFEPLR